MIEKLPVELSLVKDPKGNLFLVMGPLVEAAPTDSTESKPEAEPEAKPESALKRIKAARAKQNG